MFEKPVSHGEAEVTDDTRQTQPTSTTKDIIAAVKGVNDIEIDSTDQDATLKETRCSPADAADMNRMGKDQILVRRFRQLSIIAFVAIATATWEIGLFILSPGLIDGGRSGRLNTNMYQTLS